IPALAAHPKPSAPKLFPQSSASPVAEPEAPYQLSTWQDTGCSDSPNGGRPALEPQSAHRQPEKDAPGAPLQKAVPTNSIAASGRTPLEPALLRVPATRGKASPALPSPSRPDQAPPDRSPVPPPPSRLPTPAPEALAFSASPAPAPRAPRALER